jgi:hypothetical protein
MWKTIVDTFFLWYNNFKLKSFYKNFLIYKKQKWKGGDKQCQHEKKQLRKKLLERK